MSDVPGADVLEPPVPEAPTVLGLGNGFSGPPGAGLPGEGTAAAGAPAGSKIGKFSGSGSGTGSGRGSAGDGD